MGFILRWWNNTSIVKKHRDKWISERISQVCKEGNKPSNELRWPEDVHHPNNTDFIHTDWIYTETDRCERYVTWFFKDITRRCTVLERTITYHRNDTPGFEGGEAYWFTSYRVVEDWKGDVYSNVAQHDLSY